MERNSIGALVLAAGKGTRMNSDTPKVLHKLRDKELLSWVCDSLRAAGIARVGVILSPDVEPFEAFLTAHPDLSVCIQSEPNGTAGAAGAAAVLFSDQPPVSYAPGELLSGNPLNTPNVLLCLGDTPGLDSRVISQFVADSLAQNFDLSVLGMHHPEPKGYGRIVCSPQGDLQQIVEENEANLEQRQITLCNTGILFARTEALFSCLREVEANNSKNEYYLTDCLAIAKGAGLRVGVWETDAYQTFAGINTQDQLSEMEQWIEGRGDSCAEL